MWTVVALALSGWLAVPAPVFALPADRGWITHPLTATNYQGNCGVAAVGATLFMVGGEQMSGTYSIESLQLRALDPSTGASWNLAPALFYHRANKAVTVGGKIYSLGGMNGGTNTNYVEVYDPATDAWTGKASMPSTYYNFQVAVISGTIYVLAANNLIAYDTFTDTWSVKHKLGLAPGGEAVTLDNPGMAALGGTLYVAGGSAIGSPSNTLWIYSEASDTWTRGTQFPAVRTGPMGFAYDGSFYLAFGDDGGGSWSGLPVWQYNPATAQWIQRSKTDGNASGQATMIGATVYVGGGCCIDTFIHAGYPDNAPTLSWVGAAPYAASGVHPMVSRSHEPVTFKIRYSDPDGDPPSPIYAHVIDSSGATAAVVTLDPETGGSYATGKVFSGTWDQGRDGAYTHFFEANDAFGLAALGDPAAILTGLAGPEYREGVLIPSDLALNLPSPGKIQIRNTIVKVQEGTRGYAVIRSKQPGAKVDLNLYSSSGRPVMGLGTGQIVTDAAGLASVEIDGKCGGKPLPSGVYWVVATGDVNDKQAIVIVGTK